ncbi:MAG: leucyl aminopeptidase [Elusimicrobia bacterium]|nr:leucyl aminopeptidase [Elusimicrobiota bacterium]
MIRVQTGTAASLPDRSNTVVFCFEKERRPGAAFLFGSDLERAHQSAIEDGFSGKAGQVTLARGRGKAARYFFVGLGRQDDATLDGVRKGAAAAARRAVSMGLTSLAIRPTLLGSAAAAAQAAVEGVILGTYRFTAFQSEPEPRKEIANFFIVGKDAAEARQMSAGATLGQTTGNAVTFVRDLVNRPPSDTTPADFVRIARASVGRGVKLKIYSKAQIERMGMGGLLGVNRGSRQPPFFLHFSYRPAGKIRRRIGICGKGITFDSGGLSLKPAASMETMKYDMTGAATVLSLFTVLPKLNPPVEVHGFTPLTENMPGGNAVKPGDVLRTFRGKTIEVLNTDAEGRLILADALSYACKQPIDEVLDIATLTGACVIALGTGIVGLLGTDPALLGRLKDSATAAGEKMWELPFEKDYEPLLKSHVADIKNIGPVGQAGTILAGLFLKAFVDKGMPWAHLDIASTGWTSGQTALSEVGSTGVMVRTLLQYLLSYR